MPHKYRQTESPAEGERKLQAWNLFARLAAQFQRWMVARLPATDQTTLRQRNVYIVPTGPGWMLAITLLVLLIACINYQLSLGYLLTFLLAGACVIGVYQSHGNLRGLTLQLAPPAEQFAGRAILLHIRISNPSSRARYGIGLSRQGHQASVCTDLHAHADTSVQVVFPAGQRGLHTLPPLVAQTRFPLGTFRVWTVWRMASQVLLYPAPEVPAPAFPVQRTGGSSTLQRTVSADMDPEGFRSYRPGDPSNRILWKKVAKNDELFSRDSEGTTQQDLWLDIATATQGMLVRPGHPAREDALSRMCAWVLMAESEGMRYGLRLGGTTIPPGSGTAHQRACLRALAMDAL